MSFVVHIALHSLPCTPAHAESIDVTICDDVDTHLDFFVKSFDLVKKGRDRGEVLDTLTCIARAESTSGYVGALVCPAIFHLAEKPRVIQDHLLQIIGDDRAKAGMRSKACKLLVYVADESGRQELLRQLRRRWPRTSGELSALVELGDPGVLRWLEETAGATKNDRLRVYLETRAELVQVQESSERLLTALESGGEHVDRGWLVRQGMRHGANREDIRNAVLAYLRRIATGGKSELRESSLLAACEECRVFKDEDVKEFPAIRAFRESRKYFSADPIILEWATLISTKRAEFYGLDR